MYRFWNLSIQKKILLSMLAFTLIPIILVAAVATSITYRTMREQLIYDLKGPDEAVMLMPSDNREREVTLETLSRALDLLDLRHPHDASFNETVREAREYLKKNYYEELSNIKSIKK